LRGDRPMLGLVTMIALFSLIGFPASALLPAFASDGLGLGVEGYGAMMAAMGVGALVAGIGLAIRGRRQPHPRQLQMQRLLFAVSLAMLGLTSDLRLVLVALVAMGYALIAQLTVTNTLVQTLAPDALRGRIVSAYTWALGGFWPLGALLLGAVGQRIGVVEMFGVAGLACGVVTLLGWRLFPAPPPLEETLLDAGVRSVRTAPR
jgi:predicted MFS family arabinose efflux permease